VVSSVSVLGGNPCHALNTPPGDSPSIRDSNSMVEVLLVADVAVRLGDLVRVRMTESGLYMGFFGGGGALSLIVGIVGLIVRT